MPLGRPAHEHPAVLLLQTAQDLTAEETANLVGSREQFGSRNYGPTVATGPARSSARLWPLSSLFDEEMPDLLAASCLSRRTLYNVRHGAHEPSVATWAALERAMQLLAPSHLQGITGWREVVTAEELAHLLNCTCQDALNRLKGRCSWTEQQRARLIEHLATYRLHTSSG